MVLHLPRRTLSRDGRVVEMRKQHTPIDALILDQKNLLGFSIQRIAIGQRKVWRVLDMEKHQFRDYRTKFNAEQAICAVVKQAMQG